MTAMFAYLGPPTRRVNVQLSLDPGAASGTKVGDRDMSQLMPDRLCGSKLSGVSRGFLITVPRRRSLSSKVGHGLQALLPRPAADLRSHDLCGALVGWGWSMVLVEVCAQPSPETGQSERAFYLLSCETLSVAFLNHALPHYRSLKPAHIPPPSTQL